MLCDFIKNLWRYEISGQTKQLAFDIGDELELAEKLKRLISNRLLVKVSFNLLKM